MTCRLTAGGHVFPGEFDSMTAAGIGRNDDQLRNARPGWPITAAPISRVPAGPSLPVSRTGAALAT